MFRTNVDCKNSPNFCAQFNYVRAVKQKVRTDFFTDFFRDFENEPTVLQSKTDVSIFRVKSFYAEIFIMARKFGMGFLGG